MATINNEANAIHNVSGALIFVAYVLAALLLTCLIAVDLYKAYRFRSLALLKTTKHKSNHSYVFVSFAVLSFSTLSYHMMSYLCYSYQRWAVSKSLLPLPGRHQPWIPLGLADVISATHVWQWLTQSTLFRDFAQTICEKSASWWTQQALLATMASALFISVEGKCKLRYCPLFSASRFNDL